MNAMAILWLCVAAAAVIAEAMTTQLIAIWFAPAALIAMVLALLDVPLAVQIVVFVVTAALLVVLLYRKLRESIRSHSEKTNLDAIVGAIVPVEENIEANGFGRVLVKGVSWKASCTETALKGSKVVVERIDGVILYCRPAKTE